MSLHLMKTRFLRDTAGEGGGDAGGSGGTFLGKGGEGGTNNGSGDNGTGGTGDAPANSTPAGGNGQANWFDSLPKEMKENPVVNKYKSVEALAGAYINAQKLIGADKIPVPGKHTTDDEWRQVFQKLGLPEKVEEYGLKFKEGSVLDADFQKGLQAELHKLGVLPKQAQALADWMVEQSTNTLVARSNAEKANFDKEKQALQTLWGNAFDKKIHHANKFLMEKGGADLYKYANDKGWGGDAKFIQFLAEAAEAVYGEAPTINGDGAGEMTPKELDAEISKLQANPAYYDKLHPSHKAVVQEVKDLYAKRYPVDRK